MRVLETRSPAHIEQGHNLHAETFLLPEFFQDFRVAGLAIAEAKVGSNMHGRRVQRVNQDAAHEFQGRLAGKFAGKGQDHQQVDSRRLRSTPLCAEAG